MQVKNGVEVEVQGDAVRQHVEGIDRWLLGLRPRHQDYSQAAPREPQDRRHCIGEVGGGRTRQREQPSRGRRLDPLYGSGQSELEVDVVAAQLEQDAAASAWIEEPRFARARLRLGEIAPGDLGRPDAAADQHARSRAAKCRAEVFEEVQAPPLIADRAYGLALLPGRHDRQPVGERPCQRLLHVDREATFDRRHRRFGVTLGRRAHE